MGRNLLSAQELWEKVTVLKELSIINGFSKPKAVDDFFAQNWMQILDILDDALYEYLTSEGKK